MDVRQDGRVSSEPPDATPVALPSRDDPLVGALSQRIGGPAGVHAVPSSRWWGPVRMALAVACAVLVLGVVADLPCREDQWAERDRATWTSLCYSDVPYLYRERGFATGEVPYRDTPLEYPVLTGLVMQGSAYVARATTETDDANPALAESVRFYDVTAFLVGIAALVVVIATARTVRRRPWDGLLVAASPVLLLTATINWDLLAVAALALAILAWTRGRGALTGLLVGLGTAAKLYPVLLLGPLLLVALRSSDRRAELQRYGLALGVAAVTWVAVNLPVYLWAPDGWRAFFTFNSERGAEFGSIWYAINQIDPGRLPAEIDPLVVAAGVVLLVAIVALALMSPEPPRLAQLAFLAVAAFLLVNKVWSPQFALWLLPLAVLARPRWRDLLIWQFGEVVYFVAIWWHLAGFADPADPVISAQEYAIAVGVRVAGLLWLVGVVVRDILRPARDPVRPYTDPLAPFRFDYARL
jgi:uncharacterized membrane protein